ncbi:MAG: alpha/beta hydrolase [Candidatus Hydrogenedentota bacterium]
MRQFGRLVTGCLVVAMSIMSGAWAESDVSITPDVVYGHKDGMALTYDVIKPKKANGAAIIYMVSGGWFSRYSPPESAAKRFAGMLDSGYTVYTVRHGSAPKFKVPEAVADVENAVTHIYDHAEEHGVDPGRLGVFGGSAGGHLSLMLGCATGPVGEAPDDDAKAGKGRVAAVVAYFPPVDLRSIVGPNERFPALEFEQEDAAYVSPILHVTPDDPPTLLIHGDEDKLVPILTSETIHAAFIENKVTTDFITIPGAGHGFRGDDADVAMRAVIGWFDEHLGE